MHARNRLRNRHKNNRQALASKASNVSASIAEDYLSALPNECLYLIASWCGMRELSMLCQVSKSFNKLIPSLLLIKLSLPQGIRGRDLGLQNLSTNITVKATYQDTLRFFNKNRNKISKLNKINIHSMEYKAKPDGTETVEMGGTLGECSMGCCLVGGCGCLSMVLSMFVDLSLQSTIGRCYDGSTISNIALCCGFASYVGFVSGHFVADEIHKRLIVSRDRLRAEITKDLVIDPDHNVVGVANPPPRLRMME